MPNTTKVKKEEKIIEKAIKSLIRTTYTFDDDEKYVTLFCAKKVLEQALKEQKKEIEKEYSKKCHDCKFR